MNYDDAGVKAVYKVARQQLCNVDKLADAVLVAASVCQDKYACSQTARLGFEALTGGRSMEAPKYVQRTYFMPPGATDTTTPAGVSSAVPRVTTPAVPGKTKYPSVTYVSLTNDDSNFLSDFDGHRFLVLQCHGQVRVVQACKDECAVVGFVKEHKYAHAAATMTYDSFKRWWEDLVKALATPLPETTYKPTFNEHEEKQPRGVDTRAPAVRKVLGVSYGGPTQKSWFFQQPVQF